jgi:hypothetical protein
MNIQQIAALQAGPELDRLIHEHVFSKSGRRKPWSTTSVALEIVEAMPIACGRRLATDPDYKEDRPHWGGIIELMESEESGAAYITTSRIFCATLPLAVCKAALLSVFAKKGETEKE